MTTTRNARPTTTDRYAAIPSELKSRRRWIVAGKNKKPLQPATLTLANVTDPATWDTYPAAVAAVERAAAKSGCLHLGYVLGDGIVGVDLDHCTDTAGELSAQAAAIVRLVGGYAERSQSLTGIHILCAGKLPSGGRRRDGIELYDRDRFFIVTGDAIAGDGIPELPDQTTELSMLHRMVFPPEPTPAGIPLSQPTMLQNGQSDDDTVLSRALGLTRFRRLWSGDLTDFADGSADGFDLSAAELSLANAIANAGGDAATIDRLYRRWPHARAKWDTRRGNTTYGAMTASKAVVSVRGMPVIKVDPTCLGGGDSHSPSAAPMTDVVQSAGADCTPHHDTPCAELIEEVTRLRAELATVTADRDQWRTRAETAEATCAELRRTHTAVVAAGRNQAIKAERATAVALALDLAGTLSHVGEVKDQDDPKADLSDDGGYVPIPLKRIAESAGVSPKTAGRNIGRLADFGLIDTRTIWKPDPETGEARRQLQVRPKLSPAAMLETLATIQPDRPETWGGKRTPCPHCGEDGGTVTTTTTTISCLKCGCILSDTTATKITEPTAEVNGNLDPIAAADDQAGVKGQDVPSKTDPTVVVKGQLVPKGLSAPMPAAEAAYPPSQQTVGAKLIPPDAEPRGRPALSYHFAD